MIRACLLPLPPVVLCHGCAWADPAVIEATHGQPDLKRLDRLTSRCSHGDTGWDDYADGWRLIWARMAHVGLSRRGFWPIPHVNEQPFTRSLSGVTLPEGKVMVESVDQGDRVERR